MELCEAQRKAILKDSLAGPSSYERAAEVGLAHPNVALMQRMEESSFRQIWRITNLLLKLKRQAREEGYRETPGLTGNVTEKIGELENHKRVQMATRKNPVTENKGVASA